MPIVIFSDIDDTLIQTQRKCPANANLETGAISKTGQPLSYTTEQQRQLIALFSAHELIPVTGRNQAALNRVSIPFKHFKIIDHGAIILDSNDKIVTDWQAPIEASSQKWHPLLTQFEQDIQALIKSQKLSLRCRLISDLGFPCYLSIKGTPVDLALLAPFSSAFCGLDDNARCHINDHNMALLPPYACKKSAVQFLQQYYLSREADTLFLAAGDSCSDLPYMNHCHFSMIPNRSQITQEKLT